MPFLFGRLYRRLGAGYFALFGLFELVSAFLICAATVGMFALYVKMSTSELLEVALFAELCVAVAPAYAIVRTIKVAGPVIQWVRAGGPPDGALYAWRCGVALPRQLVVRIGWQPFGIVAVPIAVCSPCGSPAGVQMQGLSEREALREAFGSYVDPEVAERVIEEGELLEGEERDATVMFVDVREFTPFAAGCEIVQAVAALPGQGRDRRGAELRARDRGLRGWRRAARVHGRGRPRERRGARGIAHPRDRRRRVAHGRHTLPPRSLRARAGGTRRGVLRGKSDPVPVYAASVPVDACLIPHTGYIKAKA